MMKPASLLWLVAGAVVAAAAAAAAVDVDVDEADVGLDRFVDVDVVG